MKSGRSTSVISFGVLIVLFSNLRFTRLGLCTVTAAVVETAVREPGTEMSREFTTVPEAASMDCLISWMVTSGRLESASRAMSSLLDVYASFQVPASLSIACRAVRCLIHKPCGSAIWEVCWWRDPLVQHSTCTTFYLYKRVPPPA